MNFPYSDTTASFDYKQLQTVFEGQYFFERNKPIKISSKGKHSANTNKIAWLSEAAYCKKLLKERFKNSSHLK